MKQLRVLLITIIFAFNIMPLPIALAQTETAASDIAANTESAVNEPATPANSNQPPVSSNTVDQTAPTNNQVSEAINPPPELQPQSLQDTQPATPAPSLSAQPVSSLSAPSHLVVSEIQTQSATAVADEFIEITNPTPEDIALDSLEVAYVTSTGGTTTKLSLAPVTTAVSLRAHSSMLIKSSASVLTNSDATYNSGDFAIGSAGGTIQIKLNGVVVDKVGWGSAQVYESAPALVAAKGSSISRRVNTNAEFQDTDNNQSDFLETLPSPNGGGLLESVIDVCPNIDGVQEVLPSGYQLDSGGQCIQPSSDVCINLVGEQAEIPAGYEKNSVGDCVLIKQCLVEISEISAQPNFEGQEYIEFHNLDQKDVYLSACKIKINSGTEKSLVDVLVKPGEYKLVAFNNGTIRNSAGQITLINSNNEEIVYSYPTTAVGQTINFESSSQNGVVSDIPTPNSSNQTIILSEEEAAAAGKGSVGLVSVPCPTGKFRNPETNRCKNIASIESLLTPCDPGEYRSPETNRCRKVASLTSTSLKPCDPGQERNPETNRCRKVSSANSTQTPCKSGFERSPETNRCRKITSSKSPAKNLATIQPGSSKLDARILGIIAAAVLAYGAYEYRNDVRNFIGRIRGKVDSTSN